MIDSIIFDNPAVFIQIAFCAAVFNFAYSVIIRNKYQKQNFYEQHKGGPTPTKDQRPR